MTPSEQKADIDRKAQPLDERLYDAMLDAFGHDESDAQTAQEVALPFVAEALREAASALGNGPTMRVLVERESCDWWTDKPVATWLRECADRLSATPAGGESGA